MQRFHIIIIIIIVIVIIIALKFTALLRVYYFNEK